MTNKTLFPLATGLLIALVGCRSEDAQWAERGMSRTVEVQPATVVGSGAKTTASVPSVAKAPTTPKATAPAAEKPEPSVDVDADLRIKRLVIAHGVEAREPVRPANTFDKDDAERIYAFVEVDNRDRVRSEVFVTFVREGVNERGSVRLRVGAAPRWRTWAFTRLAKEEGTWYAVVRNGRGDELARRKFEVTDAPQPNSPAATS